MKSVVIVVVVLLSSRVYAQPGAGDAQTARQYTAAALMASKSGDFETAVDLYAKAYAVAPHPVLLWDIAQAHRRAAEKLHGSDAARAARHRDLAREFFRRFLDSGPDEDMEASARQWLVRLDQQWAEEYPREEAARRVEEQRRKDAAARVEAARRDDERRRVADRDRVEQERIASAVGQTSSTAELGQARTVKIAGIAGIAAGLAGVGTGAYFGFKAHQIASDLSRRDVYDPKRLAEGNTAERTMTIAYLAGGALLVGGAVTYWIGHRMGSRALERTSVTVAPSGGGATVAVLGSF
jgi:tetratricopeptide (TPR) repeat protein